MCVCVDYRDLCMLVSLRLPLFKSNQRFVYFTIQSSWVKEIVSDILIYACSFLLLFIFFFYSFILNLLCLMLSFIYLHFCFLETFLCYYLTLLSPWQYVGYDCSCMHVLWVVTLALSRIYFAVFKNVLFKHTFWHTNRENLFSVSRNDKNMAWYTVASVPYLLIARMVKLICYR